MLTGLKLQVLALPFHDHPSNEKYSDLEVAEVLPVQVANSPLAAGMPAPR